MGAMQININAINAGRKAMMHILRILAEINLLLDFQIFEERFQTECVKKILGSIVEKKALKTGKRKKEAFFTKQRNVEN